MAKFIRIVARDSTVVMVNVNGISGFSSVEGGTNVVFSHPMEGGARVHFWGVPISRIEQILREEDPIVDLIPGKGK